MNNKTQCLVTHLGMVGTGSVRQACAAVGSWMAILAARKKFSAGLVGSLRWTAAWLEVTTLPGWRGRLSSVVGGARVELTVNRHGEAEVAARGRAHRDSRWLHEEGKTKGDLASMMGNSQRIRQPWMAHMGRYGGRHAASVQGGVGLGPVQIGGGLALFQVGRGPS
jgi:hypothetical protein